MGGETFSNTAKGKSAKEAFDEAVSEARHEHGHGGYSGTIAEKSAFTVIALPFARAEGATDHDFAKAVHDFCEKLIEDGDSRVDDKWGPAGCVCLKEPKDGKDGTWVFFGWASS